MLQVLYSYLGETTGITIFAAGMSTISIILSVFETISNRALLETEMIVIIKMDLNWQQISLLNPNQFKKISNLRKPICVEMGKIVNIDHRLIELLPPIQTKSGVSITFHIRGGGGGDDGDGGDGGNNHASAPAVESNKIMNEIKKDAQSGGLSKMFYNTWCKDDRGVKHVRRPGTISNIETKEIYPDKNINGKATNIAAVINMTQQNQMKLQQMTQKNQTHLSLQNMSNVSDNDSQNSNVKVNVNVEKNQVDLQQTQMGISNYIKSCNDGNVIGHIHAPEIATVEPGAGVGDVSGVSDHNAGTDTAATDEKSDIVAPIAVETLLGDPNEGVTDHDADDEDVVVIQT